MSSPTKQQILDSANKQLNAPMTRSMGGATRNMAVRAAVDLLINFEFDSAQLQPKGANDLDQLVMALKDESMSKLTFIIEGHTDSKGTEAYNFELSQRRAQSVVNYLVRNGVGAERLESRGLGFSQPFYPQRPEAAENRRVRIVFK
jgi:outer membrane protein OmpA-like peptidoglycan-associated protein